MTNLPATPDRKPTAAERKRLASLEKIIDAGMGAFVEVGNALAEVHRDHLYRATYPSFAAYCEDRWGFTRTRGYDLMAAAEVAGEVSSMQDTPVLTNARQASALAAAPKGERADVLAAVAADEKPVTAKAIEAEVARRKPPSGPAATASDDVAEPEAAAPKPVRVPPNRPQTPVRKATPRDDFTAGAQALLDGNPVELDMWAKAEPGTIGALETLIGRLSLIARGARTKRPAARAVEPGTIRCGHRFGPPCDDCVKAAAKAG